MSLPKTKATLPNPILRARREGVAIKGIIGIGGVAKKSPNIMQLMADVLGMPTRIHRSGQTCALGAAMFAATCAGIYPTVQAAMMAMGGGFDQEYAQDYEKAAFYDQRYQKYLRPGFFTEESLHE